MQLFEENLDAWIELNLCIFLNNASESDARACSDYNLLVINRSKWLFDSANTRSPAGIWVLMGFNLEFLVIIFINKMKYFIHGSRLRNWRYNVNNRLMVLALARICMKYLQSRPADSTANISAYSVSC